MPPPGNFKIDATRWQKASTSMALLAKKKPIQDVLKMHMASFVRRVVGYTPPANDGKADGGDKARGEAAIDADVKLTLEPVSESQLSALRDFHGGDVFTAQAFRNKKGEVYLEDKNHILWSASAALEFHMKKRLPSTGRPSAFTKNGRTDRNTRRREYTGPGRSKADDIALVPPSVMKEVKKKLKEKVGILASGFARAASALGVRLPQWISRHGESRGVIQMTVTSHSVTITIINNVAFSDRVKDFERRVQKALDDEARSMERQLENTMRRLARQSGFK